MTDFSLAARPSFVDIVLGNVPGLQLISVPGESRQVGQVFQNLTPTGGQQTLPTSAETWEIVSSDTNDSSSGTGAQTVQIVSLDANHAEQTTQVSLDGTTPVTLANTHLRSRDAVVLTVGSDSSNTNLGDLSIRVSGGGAERMKIPVGIGDCKSLLYTVPLGKTLFPQSFVIFCAKNRDCTIKPRITAFGGATVESGILSSYQNGQAILITSPIKLPERTDIMLDCLSSNPNTQALVFFGALLVDNEKIA